MKIITKIKSITLVSIILVFTSSIAMAEWGEHSNKHGLHRHEAQTHYNDRFEYQHRQDYDNEYRRHHKHYAYGWRHYNRHHRYFDKHAYRHGYREHHNYYQPARVLFGLQGGDFRFLFRD